jgi:hypothetical protein
LVAGEGKYVFREALEDHTLHHADPVRERDDEPAEAGISQDKPHYLAIREDWLSTTSLTALL